MIINPYIYVSLDADAQAFITAAGITDATQQNAINTLVVDLKGYGIWSKMKAIYPFVGGTASTHKWNLKDPRDLDAAFRLVFYGGVTQNSNGITGNGTNGYADTFLANNLLGQNNNHISVYIRTIGGNGGNDLASHNGSTFGLSMYTSFISGLTAHNNAGGTFRTLTQTTQGGLYINRRLSSLNYTLQRNLTSQNFNVATTNYITTSFNFLRSANLNIEYSNKNIAFGSLGDGLTDTEAANLYTLVQNYQVALNRQV